MPEQTKQVQRNAGGAASSNSWRELLLEETLRAAPQLRLVMSDQCQPEVMVRSLHACGKTDVAECCLLQAALLRERIQSKIAPDPGAQAALRAESGNNQARRSRR